MSVQLVAISASALIAQAGTVSARAQTLVSKQSQSGDFGTCPVAAKPGRTTAFLRNDYGTAEARASFLAYGDTLKACMPVGRQYRVDIPDLRNQIAAIAYQAASPSEAK